jgi:BolA protein
MPVMWAHARAEATIVSTAFEGKSTIARHRLIYAALGDLMKKEIHALAIRAVSASEATK